MSATIPELLVQLQQTVQTTQESNPSAYFIEEILKLLMGGGGGGGTAGLSTCLFVDPAAPGPGARSTASLELPNRFPGTLAGIQAAWNAALPGDTVLFAPGTYDLASGGLVDPLTPNVTLAALTDTAATTNTGPTVLKNDGSVPLLSSAPIADWHLQLHGLVFIGLIEVLVAANPGITTAIDFKRCRGDSAGGTVLHGVNIGSIRFEDCDPTVGLTFAQCATLDVVRCVGLDGSKGGNSITYDPTGFLPGGVTEMTITVRESNVTSFPSCSGAINVDVDAGSTLDDLVITYTVGANGAVSFHGASNFVGLQFPPINGEVFSVNLDGATLNTNVNIGVGVGGANRLAMSARGCGGYSLAALFGGPIDLDLRGTSAASFGVVTSGLGEAIDREFSVMESGCIETAPGEYTVTYGVPYPASVTEWAITFALTVTAGGALTVPPTIKPGSRSVTGFTFLTDAGRTISVDYAIGRNAA